MIWGFFLCFLWYFVSHDSQTSNSTGCAATTNRLVIYFLKKKPTKMGQQGANESLLRSLEVRKVWHWQWLLKAASQLPSSMLLAVCCCCCCCCSRSRTRPQHLIRRPLVVCSSCISLCLLDELEGKWKKFSNQNNSSRAWKKTIIHLLEASKDAGAGCHEHIKKKQEIPK